MTTLLILTYVALCIGAFKLLRIAANEWTLTTAGLGGVAIVGGVLALINYNHPFTDEARIVFSTTPMTSAVQGRVIEVPVEANMPLKTGDVLFRLDPRPFQYAVDHRRAALAEAEQGVREMKAGLDAASAAVTEAAAARDRSKQAYERYRDGNATARQTGRASPFTELDEQNRRGEYLVAEAALTVAQAQAERARLALASQINGENTSVATAEAALRKAEFELEQATVRAPTNGFVTQVALQPGMVTVPFPFMPAMVYVNTDRQFFVAAFPQAVLQRLSPQDKAEIAFDAFPGRIFQGVVERVLDTIPQGQFQPGGGLLSVEDRARTPGRAQVIIKVLDLPRGANLPAGAIGQVAVYSGRFEHVAIIRQILLRMKSWLNYLVF
ncbi:HlyD family secretion protein [Phreatobacter stygius]|uniref:HlyD family secretion protein n=1 Tax=Phreatobacter stygius TaxID=1940610 RepID=A0A4D7BBX1_9HYPH|nr:HlyD family secretion protein [Phreatobacter stygius]QCI68260.1 HlyD family secretion protein [Phreatobacter stygius]